MRALCQSLPVRRVLASPVALSVVDVVGVRDFSTKAPKKGKKDEARNIETENNFKLLTAIHETAKLKPDFPPEVLAEHARIANTYNREKFRETNKLNHDLANKNWLAREALNALPPALKEQALVPDNIPRPADCPLPEWDTPPIKGFDVRKYTRSSEQDMEDLDIDM